VHGPTARGHHGDDSSSATVVREASLKNGKRGKEEKDDEM